MSAVEVTFIKIEKLIINNPKAVAILVGAIVLLAGALMANLWLGLAGFIVLFLSVLAFLPKDVRKWLMKGLGKAANDVWES